MTDISVNSLAVQVENRSWLLGPHGVEPGTTPSITLDLSLFNSAQHFPNGYIPSGTVLGKNTSTGKYGPMLAANSDGTQTAAGILFSSVRVTSLTGVPLTQVGAALVVHAFVDAAKLPFTSAATSGGFLTPAGRTALPLVYFVN